MNERRRHWHRYRSFDRADMDYPGTQYWIPSPNHVPRPGRTTMVVIHTTGGPALTESGGVNKFRDTSASIHYIVNRQGVILQMVRDSEASFHTGATIAETANLCSIGIEHVNPVSMTPTDEQYLASAKLVHWLCAQYGVPRVRTPGAASSGIKGHVDVSPNGKPCPCRTWDWDHYMGLVTSG